jgi:hypothetical protein
MTEEPPDIRPGNQVLYNASGTRVTVLQVENDMVLLETFPENTYCSKAEISGIMLTTSMLEELSFNNDEESTTWFGQGINLHTKPDGFYYGLRIFRKRAKIQYLHELQNYLADFYYHFKDENRSLNILQT